ncbi:hypothetical protein B0H14DRAFT_3864353 [Mycena olivaceomarginata]|nr:hypothetical protein B0H14DRAFT_3864353 [Mycena olivaceomarginata]
MRRPTAEPTLFCAPHSASSACSSSRASTEEQASSSSVRVERRRRDEACPPALQFLLHRLTTPAGRAFALSAPADACPRSRSRRAPLLPAPRPVLLPGTVATAPAPEVLAALPSVHLASFGKDENICVRRPSHTSPSPSTHSMHAVAFPVSLHRYAATPTPGPAYPPPAHAAHTARDATHGEVGVVPVRIRRAHFADFRRETEVVVEEEVGPVKGLIPFSLSSAPPPLPPPTPLRPLWRWACVRYASPSPPLVSVDGEAGEGEDEGNEDASWVDADDDDDYEGEGQDEDGEMTVRSPHASPALSADVAMVLGAPPRV